MKLTIIKVTFIIMGFLFMGVCGQEADLHSPSTEIELRRISPSKESNTAQEDENEPMNHRPKSDRHLVSPEASLQKRGSKTPLVGKRRVLVPIVESTKHKEEQLQNGVDLGSNSIAIPSSSNDDSGIREARRPSPREEEIPPSSLLHERNLFRSTGKRNNMRTLTRTSPTKPLSSKHSKHKTSRGSKVPSIKANIMEMTDDRLPKQPKIKYPDFEIQEEKIRKNTPKQSNIKRQNPLKFAHQTDLMDEQQNMNETTDKQFDLINDDQEEAVTSKTMNRRRLVKGKRRIKPFRRGPIIRMSELLQPQSDQQNNYVKKTNHDDFMKTNDNDVMRSNHDDATKTNQYNLIKTKKDNVMKTKPEPSPKSRQSLNKDTKEKPTTTNTEFNGLKKFKNKKLKSNLKSLQSTSSDLPSSLQVKSTGLRSSLPLKSSGLRLPLPLKSSGLRSTPPFESSGIRSALSDNDISKSPLTGPLQRRETDTPESMNDSKSPPSDLFKNKRPNDFQPVSDSVKRPQSGLSNRQKPISLGTSYRPHLPSSDPLYRPPTSSKGSYESAKLPSISTFNSRQPISPTPSNKQIQISPDTPIRSKSPTRAPPKSSKSHLPDHSENTRASQDEDEEEMGIAPTFEFPFVSSIVSGLPFFIDGHHHMGPFKVIKIRK